MKKLLPLIAIVLLHLGACKKSTDSSTTPTTTGDNSWVLAGVSYKTLISIRTLTSGGTVNTLFNFYDVVPSATAKINSVTLSFVTAPTASGTYQLVGVGQAKTATQCEIAVGTAVPSAYGYIGASTDITVTVTGGKVKIVVPEITLKGTTGQADAKFSGSLQEL